jgi:hypothetical protein
MNDETSYRKWFDKLLVDFYLMTTTSESIGFDEFKETCCFFVTMTFDSTQVKTLREQLALSGANPSIELDNFHLLYSKLCRALFGRGFERRKKNLPLAIVAVDYAGSRVTDYRAMNGNNLHIHAMFAVSPADRVAFKELLGSLKWHRILNGLHADKVVFDPYRLVKDKKGRLGSYVAKAFIKARDEGASADCLRTYPGPNPHEISKSYKASHRYQPTSRALVRLQKGLRNERREFQRLPKWERTWLSTVDRTEEFNVHF